MFGVLGVTGSDREGGARMVVPTGDEVMVVAMVVIECGYERKQMT